VNDERTCECWGCKKQFPLNEFRVNKSRNGIYCKNCQKVLESREEDKALAEMANESQRLGLYEDFDTGEEGTNE
jgi:hypothetical protein